MIANVKRLQRVLRITPTSIPRRCCLLPGLDSATQIAARGSQQFFTQALAAGLTKVEANRIFHTAAHRYASVVSTMLQLNRDFIGVWPTAVGASSALDDPTKRRFSATITGHTVGSQDYCAIEDCTWCSARPRTCATSCCGCATTGSPARSRPRSTRSSPLAPGPRPPPPQLSQQRYAASVHRSRERAARGRGHPPATPVWKQTTQTAAELRAVHES